MRVVRMPWLNIDKFESDSLNDTRANKQELDDELFVNNVFNNKKNKKYKGNEYDLNFKIP